VDELIVASRAVHFAALALLLGAPAFRLAISPLGPARGWPGGGAIELAAAALALASALGWFAGVAAGMAGSWSDAVAPDMLQTVALETRFGRLWTARLAALAVILAIEAFARPAPAKDAALVFLAGAVTASLVGTGHGTAGEGALGPVHAVADVTHLLCAMGWVGGLFCLAQPLRRIVRGEAEVNALHAVLRRFSRVGYWTVALLLVSGGINGVILVPSVAKLVGTDYGRVLLVKIALALAMVTVALVNRFALTPKISAAGAAGVHALRRSVLLEQGVGLLVLVSVALLGTIHPVP
jgi:putative copper resistance protein D